MTNIAYFECSRCSSTFQPLSIPTVCERCAGTLYVRYELAKLKGLDARDSIEKDNDHHRWRGMWRYRDVLPRVEPVEGANPTGTFKARGLSMAISMLGFYGVKKVAVPSAGNAGGAVAAYSAAAGIEAHIFMPKDVPLANQVESIAYGANMTLVDGLISDCARIVGERKKDEGWFDLSTLKEPFRVEGKKTMGYELVE
jgi:threonine synthase